MKSSKFSEKTSIFIGLLKDLFAFPPLTFKLPSEQSFQPAMNLFSRPILQAIFSEGNEWVINAKNEWKQPNKASFFIPFLWINLNL